MISGITNHADEDSRKQDSIEELKRSKLMAEGNLKAVGITP